MKNIGQYAKAVIAGAYAITTAIMPYMTHYTWAPIVYAGVGALLVYAIPNSPAPAAVPTPNTPVSAPQDTPKP